MSKETDKTEESSSTVNQKKSSLTTTQIILIIGFSIVIVTIAIVGAFFVLKSMKPPVVIPRQDSMVITPENYDEVQALMKAKEDDNTFFVELNRIWTFKNSDAYSEDAVMVNSELNKSSIFITVELEGTDEVVYESPIMTPGASLKNIKLNKKLAPDTYSARCVHHVLYPDGTEETTVQMALDIIVEN